jgi:hypothetical protein
MPEQTQPRRLKARHGWILVLIALGSVPWWWPEESIEPFILGMPGWALASLLLSLLFAFTTAFLLLRRWDVDGDK